MGSPKKIRRKYQTPRHPWEKTRIEVEGKILKEYALKNKKELWKQKSLLRKYTNQAKRLVNLETKQAEKEKEQVLTKLHKLGLIKKTSNLDDVLSLALKDILERRLQTIIFKKNLAKSIKQARQFITHNHILVNDKRITSPSYLVSIDEEDKILFNPKSSLKNIEHPERLKEEKKEKKIKPKEVKKKQTKKIEKSKKKIEKKNGKGK